MKENNSKLESYGVSRKPESDCSPSVGWRGRLLYSAGQHPGERAHGRAKTISEILG